MTLEDCIKYLLNVSAEKTVRSRKARQILKYLQELKQIKESSSQVYWDSLKTCPFCNKKSQIETKENWAHNKTLYAVRCTTSKCQGHPINPVWYDTKEEAIKNWSRREG